MVGRDDQDRVIPVAVGFDPANDGSDGLFAAIDRADGVVEIIGMESEIDVAGLDEQGEWLVGLRTQHGQGGLGHLGQGGLFDSVGRGVPLGRAQLALAADAGCGVIASVGGLERKMIEPVAAEEAEQPRGSPGRIGGGTLSMPGRR